MVKRVLEEVPNTRVVPIKYGYLDAFRFWFPFLTREAPIADLRREIQNAERANPEARVSIIAHSFGTYAVSRILSENPNLKIERLILSGSIVPRSYRWDYVDSRLATDVVNDYGTRDIWPVLAKCLSWGYGDTGRHGFGRGATVRDRGHNYSHSEFFNEQFVRTYWKPWFESNDFVSSPWEESAPPTPWWLSVLSVLPLQWFLIALVIVLLVWIGYAIRPNVPENGTAPSVPSILAGTVLETETKEPLADVLLTIQDFDNTHGETPFCRSDANGRFRFTDLPPSKPRQVELVARKPSYRLHRSDPWLGDDRHPVTLQKE
jgi:hypothetical protein